MFVNDVLNALGEARGQRDGTIIQLLREHFAERFADGFHGQTVGRQRTTNTRGINRFIVGVVVDGFGNLFAETVSSGGNTTRNGWGEYGGNANTYVCQ